MLRRDEIVRAAAGMTSSTWRGRLFARRAVSANPDPPFASSMPQLASLASGQRVVRGFCCDARAVCAVVIPQSYVLSAFPCSAWRRYVVAGSGDDAHPLPDRCSTPLGDVPRLEAYTRICRTSGSAPPDRLLVSAQVAAAYSGLHGLRECGMSVASVTLPVH